jgi:hypothetical protein
MDEGQDLLNMADLNKLDGVLKGGFVNGQWYFFHDANNQSNLLAAVEPDALDWLKSKNNPAVLKLRVNCRNTTNILNAIQSELKCEIQQPKKSCRSLHPHYKSLDGFPLQYQQSDIALQLI